MKYHGPQRMVKATGRVGPFLPIGPKHDRAIDGERCRKSFRYFVSKFWDIANPNKKYIDAPHIHAVSDHLQAVTDGHIKKLGICIPPGHAKSLLTSVLWPAWEWSHSPSLQSLFLSYDPSLSTRDSVRCRMVIESDQYQTTFNPDWHFRPDQNEKTYYVNTKMGSRYSFGFYSRLITGWRGDKTVIDDPMSIKDRYNNAIKANCIDVLDTTVTSRVNDRINTRIVIIMQRLAENDLIGHVQNNDEWEILKLPSEFHVKKRCQTSIGWSDWRTEEGELLFPQLFPQSEIDKIKNKELTLEDYSAQHDQEPVPQGGSRFKQNWFGRWSFTDHTCHFIKLWNAVTEKVDIVPFGTLTFFVSVDSAVGEKRTNDYTVYIIWGKLLDGRLIIVDRFKDRMTEPDSISLALSLMKNKKYGSRPLSYFAIEVNGVGKPLSQNIERQSIPVVAINVHTDKLAMSTSAVVLYANGKVHHPERASWLLDFEKCLTEFPFGDHDDDVSSISIGAESLSLVFGRVQSSKPVIPEKESVMEQMNKAGSTPSDREGQKDSGRIIQKNSSRNIMGIPRR